MYFILYGSNEKFSTKYFTLNLQSHQLLHKSVLQSCTLQLRLELSVIDIIVVELSVPNNIFKNE